MGVVIGRIVRNSKIQSLHKPDKIR